MKKKRGEEKKRRRRGRRRGKVWKLCMEYYGFVWRLFVYGTCMEVFLWMLVVPFLGFS